MCRKRVVPALAALVSLAALGLCLHTPALADVVHLKDGRRIEGSIKRTPDGWTITAADGAVTTVPPSQVVKVELTGNQSAAAADKLASLLRALEAEPDIDQIVARLERFAAANPNTPAADQATREAALYRERKAKGMQRIGGRWLSPDQHAAMLGELSGRIENAVSLAAGAQWRDAEAAVDEILALDARNISALYLQGLILYQQDKIIPARKAFEAVNAQIADHAPTLNNLAVIAYRQNQHGVALNLYEQAMAAVPKDRPILDNVAEALHELSQDEQGRRMPILKRLERTFQQQDEALAVEMLRENLYRWGATWVDRPTYERLLAEERRIAERVAQLDAARREAEREVLVIQDRIVATEQSIRRVEADRYAYATDGTLLVMPLPAAYYDLQRDLAVLRGDRLRAIAAVDAAKADIRAAQQELPVPRFSGVQRLIGPEGTPVERPAAPAADGPPATEPSAPPRRPATAPASRTGPR